MLDPYKLEDLIHQVRARVSWGEAPDSIAKWLADEGVEQKTIDDILDAAYREREAQVRKLGMSEMIKGLLIAAVFGALLYFRIQFTVNTTTRRSASGFAFCVGGVIFGLVRFVRGLLWLMQGKSVRGSVGDLDQSA
ncbi:MAG TPA: hypothetical protein VKX17_13165 [Planctomycetota bacterium]|nr:hypothetical protein [Planctomycetota bacterium]